MVLNVGIRQSDAELGLGRSNLWIHRGAGIDAAIANYKADSDNRPMPLYFLTFPRRNTSWPERHPRRATVDDAGMTTWKLFEPFAGTAWMNRRALSEIKHMLTEELIEQMLRFCPQLRGNIDHAELATPLSFNHFLNREHGDFMSLAATPNALHSQAQRTQRHPNLYLSCQGVTAAGVVGAD